MQIFMSHANNFIRLFVIYSLVDRQTDRQTDVLNEKFQLWSTLIS